MFWSMTLIYYLDLDTAVPLSSTPSFAQWPLVVLQLNIPPVA